jgi:hypothetical protein
MLADMTLFPNLALLPRQLRHPAVRDLAWTLCSSPLLGSLDGLQPRHPLRASGWATRPEQLADWLQALDCDPQPLLAQLPAVSGNRLGRYYEELWQFALRQAPDIRLLAANLAVRDHGRTLGEMDLLLEDREGLQHIELAVKFYLGPSDSDGRGARDWLGPGRLDRLDLKLEHLLQHQLPLSARPEARALVEPLSSRPLQASLWLAGYLFYPWPSPCSAPTGASPQHLRGHWVQRRDWPAWREASGHRWQPLPRLRWLAPAGYPAEELWSDAQLEKWLGALPEDAAPRMLVGLKEEADGFWQERERIFLVNDHWPLPARVSSTR